MMKNNTESIAEALTHLLKPFCEVILHDLSTDTVKQVFGNASDRQIGEPSYLNELGIHSWDNDVHGPYRKTTSDGHTVKSISIVIRNDAGKPINLMCINIDVSHFEFARTILSNLTSVPEKELDNPLANDWLERLHVYIASWATDKGIQIKNIQPEMRKKLVMELHDNGVFNEKNSAFAVAKSLGVSRATIYQDLRVKQ